jgi:hypothetical protein
MSCVRLFWLAGWFAAWGLLGGAHAQNMGSATSDSSELQTEPQDIAIQRQALAEQRDAILKNDEQRQAMCWQKFAVNACLIESRRIRRQALDPLAQQELVLNARERAWRSTQRDLRLLGKQPDKQGTP